MAQTVKERFQRLCVEQAKYQRFSPNPVAAVATGLVAKDKEEDFVVLKADREFRNTPPGTLVDIEQLNYNAFVKLLEEEVLVPFTTFDRIQYGDSLLAKRNQVEPYSVKLNQAEGERNRAAGALAAAEQALVSARNNLQQAEEHVNQAAAEFETNLAAAGW